MIEYKVKVHFDGTKEWWLNGKLHREDGPAYESYDGTKEWWLNGKLHREDGPAIEYSSGTKVWYLNGSEVTKEQHAKRTSKVQSLTVAEISKLLGYEVTIVKG